MSNRKKQIFQVLEKHQGSLSATAISQELDIDRSNVSRLLSDLYKEGKLERIEGRPVLYQVKEVSVVKTDNQLVSFDHLVGREDSLKLSIQQAKAAMLYPPRGLHTILFGESGTGKSLFAECMYEFGLSSESLPKEAPFISFNCADYAQTPQLLFSHIFGVKKGAYTGADEDKPGLIEEADGGILFLDEIHRLPPEGQEMLFTFIDKGIYRPLGESAKTYEASVQIIGATTESSDVFLATFNRRIPMSITLPSLRDRTLDERFEVVTLFLAQEASRLNNRIDVDKDAIMAFMLYETEGNIGQVKRDLKLVCAKSFLHYRTNKLDYLSISVSDLPLQVQKGLLKVKEIGERADRFFDTSLSHLSFEPGVKHVVWTQDKMQNMDVYSTIEDKVSSLSKVDLETIDLEGLIESNLNEYFEVYVNELSRNDIHKELIDPKIWRLTDCLYDLAEDKLGRSFNERTRFTFSLHLQSTIERIKNNKTIIHPDLNGVRKKYLAEFQVAIELSSLIEKEFNLEIPFDEIGFLTMFLTFDLSDDIEKQDNKVKVLLLMHGKSTASSMLEAVQDLLGIESGMAFNMPLTMEVTQMYDLVKNYVNQHKDELSSGVLILTDMGSLNSFSHMLTEETGIFTKTISMVTTLVVLESVRMASMGRSLKEIYQNIQLSFESAVHSQFRTGAPLKKAVVVTCFTGEGVSNKLAERVKPVMDAEKIEIIQLQFLEKSAFQMKIDELLDTYDIKAVVGTVDVNYQNIPFFSAYDIFKDEELTRLRQLVSKEISVDDLALSLDGAIKSVPSLVDLLTETKNIAEKIENDLSLILEPGVDMGIILHLSFLVDNLLTDQHQRLFKGLDTFKKTHRYEMDIVKMTLINLEKTYHIHLPEDEIAYITEMFLKNKISN
ncbi:sigma 54-interacting transcriptional regulator [Vagococcus sp. DIV0080]|uniref:DNA translocase FtsK n=1 Tax=Candidatus Vagococcus giribetii TaxID=2230876 RepID=A0ABS3HVN8_9ENTE|nr:sigma-54-dependent transcriptional regulator [Vagococcus sp. DIV0080]MBO0477410.1 sigma 54-interacting transcriptional regulator [Vagococcus sp. DIV0080]